MLRGLVLLAFIACRSAPSPIVEIPGTDPGAPLVVGLHGRGGNAKRFAHVFDGAALKNDVISVQGSIAFEGGFAWFNWPPDTSDADLAVAIDDAVAQVWPVIAERAHGRKVIVTGFSQGAMMAYAIAVRHPDDVAFAVPMAGFLPPTYAIERSAPVYALHGTDDHVLSIDDARETIERIRKTGAHAELQDAPVDHTIAPVFVDALLARIRN